MTIIFSSERESHKLKYQLVKNTGKRKLSGQGHKCTQRYSKFQLGWTEELFKKSQMFEEPVWESQCGSPPPFLRCIPLISLEKKKKGWKGFLSKRMKSETDILGQMQSYNSAFPVKVSSLLISYFEKFQALRKVERIPTEILKPQQKTGKQFIWRKKIYKIY